MWGKRMEAGQKEEPYPLQHRRVDRLDYTYY